MTEAAVAGVPDEVGERLPLPTLFVDLTFLWKRWKRNAVIRSLLSRFLARSCEWRLYRERLWAKFAKHLLPPIEEPAERVGSGRGRPPHGTAMSMESRELKPTAVNTILTEVRALQSQGRPLVSLMSRRTSTFPLRRTSSKLPSPLCARVEHHTPIIAANPGCGMPSPRNFAGTTDSRMIRPLKS